MKNSALIINIFLLKEKKKFLKQEINFIIFNEFLNFLRICHRFQS